MSDVEGRDEWRSFGTTILNQCSTRNRARVPCKPDPPVAQRVTFNSVTLSWKPSKEMRFDLLAKSDDTSEDMIYHVQKADSLKKTFSTVYKGPTTIQEFSLSFINHQYSFRVQCINDAGASEWSEPAKVETDDSIPNTIYAAIRSPTEMFAVGGAIHTVVSLSASIGMIIAPEDILESIKLNNFSRFENLMKNYPCYSEKEFIEQNPLMAACANGKTKFAEHLIHKCKVRVNFQGHYGMTSLMEACKGGHRQCVKLLLDAGATFKFETRAGLTAMHYAALGEDSVIMDMILSKGAPPDIVGKTDKLQNTPLLCLVQNYGKADIARVLLDHGANVNRKNKAGFTPLILAARKETTENLKLVQLFLEYGADPSITVNNDFDKIDALGYAMAATNDAFHPLPKEMKGATKLLQDALNKHIMEKN